MKTKVAWLFGLVLTSILGQAQTGNIWLFSTKYSGFDFNYDPPALTTSAMHTEYNTSAVCDSFGKLLLYTDGDTIWNGKHKIIEGGVIKGGTFELGFTILRVMIIAKPGSSGIYYVFCSGLAAGIYYNDTTYGKKLCYHVVDMNANGGEGAVISSFNYLTSDFAEGVTATYHENGRHIWLVSRIRDSLLAFRVTENGIESPVKTYDKKRMDADHTTFKPSPGGKLFVGTRMCINKYTGAKEDSTYVYLYRFDNGTGLFSPSELLYQGTTGATATDTGYYLFKDAVFSANDSVLYLLTTNSHPWGGARGVMWQYKAWQTSILNQFSFPPANAMQLAPNGKIYIISSGGADADVSVINRPDSFGPACDIKWSIMRFLGHPYEAEGFPNILYQQIRLDFSYSGPPSCTGSEFSFINSSDTTRYKSFTWYWGDGDSLVTGTSARTVKHQYKTPGEYQVKLKAITTWGYPAQRSEKVRYGKEMIRPKAAFSSQSLSGCQYVAFSFNDLTQSDTALNPVWHWNFGDGTDSTVQSVSTPYVMNHTYLQSGEFPITLIYINGFCSDTFSMLSKVSILPAPRPGFSASPLSGCAPLPVEVKRIYGDQVDSLSWEWGDGESETIQGGSGSASMHHTYLDALPAGKYLIRQILYGPTGCVTRDSIPVILRPGFSKDLQPEMLLGTVKTSGSDTSIVLTWRKMAFAKEYKLYTNGVYSFTIADTNYTLSVNNKLPGNTYFFLLTAVDSCDKESGMGSLIKPVILNHSFFNNTQADMEWNPYETYSAGVKVYEVQKWLEKKQEWKTIASQNGNYTFTDASLLESGQLKSCYRVLAMENGGYHLTSYSNIICLPYSPSLWVPNTFSPNGDGINDELRLMGIGIDECHIKIYNSWGEKVFESDDISESFTGKGCSEGVYYYVLFGTQANKRKFSQKGTIQLLK